jgi:hypothetical protein
MAEEKRAAARERTWAAEERVRMLIDSVRDYAIFMLNPEGYIESWNPGAQRLNGYRTEEILGAHISRFYPPEEVMSGKAERELHIADTEGRFEEEGWRVRKDGSRFWASVVITAMRAPSGELLGFAKVTHDLSQKREAEERLRLSEERFRLLVAGVKDYAIFMLDPTGHVATWNAGAERIKGYTPQEIIGQSFTRFYPEEDVQAGKCDLELEGATREGRFEDEGWRVRKDGSRFWANVVITAMRNASGQLIGFAKVTRDLTERRLLEEEKVRVAQAQEALRLRDEFLSIASHELKTPLTALQFQLDALGQRAGTLDEKTMSKVQRAARSSERLAELIETLLDVSRIATGRFELSPQRFDLAEAVHDVVERLRDSAVKAGCELSLKTEGPVPGTWDRLRVEQVLTNILSNAMKYAAGTPIDVSLTREEESAVLQVRDRGPGIPEEALTRIFGRFERAVSMRHYGGMGLGLYIVREIVDAHGGTVTARNLPEGGAHFTVRLPFAPSPRSRPEPAETRSLE